MNGILKTTQVHKHKMEKLAHTGFSAALELADTLVREYRLPFCVAHEIVGAVVKKGTGTNFKSTHITAKIVQESVREVPKKEIHGDPDAIRRACARKSLADDQTTGKKRQRRQVFSDYRSPILTARDALWSGVEETIGGHTS